MVDKGKIEDFKRKYINEGINQGNVRKVRKEIKRELLSLTSEEEMDRIWEEIEAAGKEAEKGVEGIGGAEVKLKELNANIDKALKGVIVHKKGEGRPISLATKHLSNLDLDTVTLKPGIDKGKYDSFIGVINGLIIQGKKVELPNISKLEDVLDIVSRQWANKSSAQDINTIVARSSDIFDEIVGADIKYAQDRKGIYRYWKGISEKYDRLSDALEKLKEVVKEDDFEDAFDVKDKIMNLKLPEDYVVNIKPFKMRLDRPEIRIIKFLKMLSPKAKGYGFGEQTAFEAGTSYSERGEYYTTLQQPRSKTRELGGKEGEVLSEKSLEFADLVTEGYVDAILWWAIKEEILDIPVVMVDAFEKEWETLTGEELLSEIVTEDIEGKLSAVLSKLKADSPEANKVEKVLEELSDVAGDKSTVSYLPASDWLKEIDGLNIIPLLDRIERGTGKFFNELSEIFIENIGQLPVSMPPNWPKYRGRHGGTPATFGFKTGLYPKPEPKGLKKPRAQSGIPSKTRTFDNKEFVNAQENFFKAISDYYWKPLARSGRHFIEGEKPRFIDDVKGEFPYRVLRFNFGDIPEVKAQRKLLVGAADNLKINDLRRIKDYLSASTSEKITEGVHVYIQNVERVVRSLNKIFDDSDKENKLWGAGKIGRALKRSLSEVRLDELDYFGKPLEPLYDKYEDTIKEVGGEEELPIYSLRTLLTDINLQNILRSKERFMEKKDFKQLQDLIESIVDLTDPERHNKDNEVNKAILKVYDSIRKMQNKPIYYDTMYLEDINTMDYIVTKMEKEFKLDITSLEINEIVKSLDSINNLSKKYGINEEAVYIIKGLCR